MTLVSIKHFAVSVVVGTVMLGAQAHVTAAAEPAASGGATEDTGKGVTYVLYYDSQIEVTGGDHVGRYCLGAGSVVSRIVMPSSGGYRWRVAQAESCASGPSAIKLQGALVSIDEESAVGIQVSSGGLQFAYGALVVPYKLQLTGKQETHKAGPTGAIYLGGKVTWPAADVDLTFFGFGGASDVALPVGGQQTDVFAISYGAGLNFGINGLSSTFDLGIVVGFDHIDDSKNYEYNDKPWIGIALSIGN